MPLTNNDTEGWHHHLNERQKFRKYQELIFNIWDEYRQKKIGPNQSVLVFL